MIYNVDKIERYNIMRHMVALKIARDSKILYLLIGKFKTSESSLSRMVNAHNPENEPFFTKIYVSLSA